MPADQEAAAFDFALELLVAYVEEATEANSEGWTDDGAEEATIDLLDRLICAGHLPDRDNRLAAFRDVVANAEPFRTAALG